MSLPQLVRAAIMVAAICTGVAPSPRAEGENLRGEAKSLRAKYARDIEQLAAWCEKEGLAPEAKQTRAIPAQDDPCKLYLPVLPREVGPLKLAEDSPAALVQWNTRLTKLREEDAAALYDLARRAIRQHQPSLAYEVLLTVIGENPDHEGARRVFGYQKFHDQWRTAYEARKLRSGMVWHEKFGWLSKANLQRYLDGQRPAGSRWISAQEDARLHRDIRSGWEVESEHYQIRTNRSIEAAVALGQKLETLCRLWQQIFIRFHASEAYIDGLLNGRAQTVRGDAPRYNVVYFRDHDDYTRSLRSRVPNLGISLGIYMPQDRTAYFFAGDEDAGRVLNHEATHQLFQQTRHAPLDVGRNANFWVIEGIAMFMETLHQEHGYYVLGGLDDVRMLAARQHLIDGDFFVPLAQLTAYGTERLQSDPKVSSLYSQMAAMTNFLVFYDGGRYRDALVAYLTAVYSNRATLKTLAELTGAGYAELDRQYQEFMKAGGPQ
ncbi:MAG: hypothetical protein ABSG68_24915 [Thermoguttaceae bacterium]|jgi:hypothetical protein